MSTPRDSRRADAAAGGAPSPAAGAAPPGPLVAAVQTNCHIADSRHAADLPLCTYLLQMRELYRWERGLPFVAPIDRREVGDWLAAREGLWAELEGAEFVTLPIGRDRYDPFDVEAINAALAPLGLCYGAGMAGAGRHDFFLARLHARGRCDDVPLVIGADEAARGLIAPAAALVGAQCVVVRRESLARWVWEKFESHRLYRANRPFEALLRAHGVDDDDAFASALPGIVDEQTETLVLHERGERRAARWLEPSWSELRLLPQSRRTELHLRAVRDHLADLELTLPTLLERGAERALHFWFANFDGVRAQLFPRLHEGYDAWRNGDGGTLLRRLAHRGGAHFRGVTRQVLALHARHGDGSAPAIERLLTSPASVYRAP